jgi:MoaA/NifB/PqqE/SkfB family radical SAM enzyme
VDRSAIIGAWGRVLAGRRPNLSVEITHECPLRCPGCYAYGDDHLGGGIRLRQLADYQGQALIDGVIGLVRRHRPVHLSIVGGEPLVRFRELDEILPVLTRMGIHTQVVTSAVRPIPSGWAGMQRLQVCVSVDGLQPEHDARRSPATYDRILKHIRGQQVTIHCTVTRQQTRPGYVSQFAAFWAAQPDVRKIWFSLYTPQRGEVSDERLGAEDRRRVVAEIRSLVEIHPKLQDMRPSLLAAYLQPPEGPASCLFARSTACVSSDLKAGIRPCQFGGNPECRECGCMASAALDAVGRHRLGGFVPVGAVFTASERVGGMARRWRRPEAEA